MVRDNNLNQGDNMTSITYCTIDKNVYDILKDIKEMDIDDFVKKYEFKQMRDDIYRNRYKSFNYASVENPIYIRIVVDDFDDGAIFSSMTVCYGASRSIQLLSPSLLVSDDCIELIDVLNPYRNFTIQYDDSYENWEE